MSTSYHQPSQDHFGGVGASGWSSVNDLSGLPGTGNQVNATADFSSTGNFHVPTTATMSSVSPTTSAGDGLNAISNKSSPKKRSADTSPATTGSPPDEDRVCKRQRNTEAARRYRQRKVDRVSELEDALAAMTKANDDLKLKLARSEAEVDVLRGLVGKP